MFFEIKSQIGQDSTVDHDDLKCNVEILFTSTRAIIIIIIFRDLHKF